MSNKRIHPPIINMWSTMEKERLRGEILSMRNALKTLGFEVEIAKRDGREVMHVACTEAIEVIQEHLDEAQDMWCHDYTDEP